MPKVILEGHKYALPNKENPSVFQTLSFINKAVKTPGMPELYTVHDGTTTEEVMEMIIDRLEHLNARVASEHNSNAIIHLKLALDALHIRTNSRVERGVEGKEQA